MISFFKKIIYEVSNSAIEAEDTMLPFLKMKIASDIFIYLEVNHVNWRKLFIIFNISSS